MTRLNLVCLLLAVAGLSFAVGQSTGQDQAAAGPQATESAASNKAVVRELKKMKFELWKIAFSTEDSSSDLALMRNTIGERPKDGKPVRELLRQICLNGAQFSWHC